MLVTTSGWHPEPGNQAAGKLGGSAPNGLLEIIPKLSMNYPRELRHSKSVRPCPLMGLGRGRVLDEEVCVLRALSGGDLDGAALVSVS